MATSRTSALHQAARLCTATVAWNVVVGGAAVATAIVTGSLALIGFGINGVVDSSASTVLVWRFRAEAAGRQSHAERAERIALRLAGVAFALIATYLAVQGTRSLLERKHAQATAFGITEAVASLVVLPWLASRKYKLSQRLRSDALRADSLLSWSGAALALVALAALLLDRGLGWDWGDPVGALAIAAILAVQGVRVLRNA